MPSQTKNFNPFTMAKIRRETCLELIDAVEICHGLCVWPPDHSQRKKEPKEKGQRTTKGQGTKYKAQRVNAYSMLTKHCWQQFYSPSIIMLCSCLGILCITRYKVLIAPLTTRYNKRTAATNNSYQIKNNSIMTHNECKPQDATPSAPLDARLQLSINESAAGAQHGSLASMLTSSTVPTKSPCNLEEVYHNPPAYPVTTG